MSYSAHVRQRMSFAELKPHIFTLPDQPDLIPYRTSYYKETWGFCMSHRQLQALEAAGGDYEVVIDSRLEPGEITWGEYLHKGESEDEVLLSTHICPSSARRLSSSAPTSIPGTPPPARRTTLTAWRP
jgi:aminopeptidase-like protein